MGSFCLGAFACSSSMISRQRSIHSSQIYTPPGPAISRWTCSWLLPQNEQRYWTRGGFVLAMALLVLRELRKIGVDEYFVHYTVLFGFLGGHKEVPLGIVVNLLVGLPAMVGQNLIQPAYRAKNPPRLHFDIRGGALEARAALVNHDLGIGKGVPLPLGARGKEHRGHTGAHSHAVGLDIGLDLLHSVVDGQ